ncbi:tumor necrosis factor-like [Haliotis rubra]|uniref:tumor necrosis factor-like n=1 Tax=Haliotis rubra TaxID=36100 RepID=UPI001EE6323A|nr:tumor necrosis factor-like [Haliotis rubra]
METPAKRVAATVLLLNIAVGIGVICLVVSRQHHEHWKTSEILKQQLIRIYTEHLEKTQATFTNAGTNKAKPRTPADLLNLLKPIAYFPGLDLTGYKEADTSEDTPIRNWVPFIGPGRQLLYNGMKYENGSIVVPATGVYVVYSHVKFYTEKNRQGDSESDFHHNIARYSALKQEEETVLRDVISENKNNIIDGASLEYSSDIHGLVQLDAGDQLMLKVSGMKPLTHDRDWHYVGVYLT